MLLTRWTTSSSPDDGYSNGDGDVNGDHDDGSRDDGGRVLPHRQQRRPLRRLHLLLLLVLQCQIKTITFIAVIPGFDFVHHFDRPRLVEPA